MGIFLKAVKLGYQRYFDFNGRSTRPEYWWWTLWYWGVLIFGGIVANIAPLLGILMVIFLLSAIIPNLAVTIRRLHDTNRSGFWFFISLVPFVGGLWLLVLMCSESTMGPNQWGAEPTNGQHEAARRFAEERSKPPAA
jgi:uncharacterized membrane protein YhaH (DUF805 family)